MNKKKRCVIISVLLCVIIAGPMHAAQITKQSPNETLVTLEHTDFTDIVERYARYMPQQNEGKTTQQTTIDLPWRNTNIQMLEWWIVIEYKEKTFESMVPVSISDFNEKFLKHPEYGEIIRFDIDNDNENDIEIIAGFYWTIIKDANGNDIESLEKRIRFRQLETGNYIDDVDTSITVWSELHVNYGLFKKTKTTEQTKQVEKLHTWIKNAIPFFNEKRSQQQTIPLLLLTLKDTLCSYLEKIVTYQNRKPIIEPIPNDDNDYISVGMGFRSNEGEDIPRYMEKRFSFGRDQLFSPAIFQQDTDPGTTKGQSSYENLYGFKSYKSGSTTPSYDIELSAEISPAVSIKTKFVPLNGQVYYYFDETSQQTTPTEISYTTNILQGSGEDIELSLLFQSIDSSVGKTGEWMGFDIDLFGDHDLLSGNLHYTASNRFTIGMMLNSPAFEEKIEFKDIPTRVDIAWDLDFTLIPSPVLFANVKGMFNVSMNNPLGNLIIYYPKTEPEYEDKIFLSVPYGIPRTTHFEASATLNLDITNILDRDNYVSARVSHDCNENIDTIQVFLPDEDIPIIKVTDIPSSSSVNGQLYWNQLKGHASMWRGSTGPPDPIEINLDYKNYHIHDIITIRNGHISTKFKVDTNGYFFFDTSPGIIGNALEVSNMDSGDSIALFVDEVSANDLQANWDIDTTGERLKINDLGFNGMVDTLKGLTMDITYQGKDTAMTLDWILGQTGFFQFHVDQEEDLSIDFSQLGLNTTQINLEGGITLSEDITIDMDWQLKQGEETQNGNVDPGHFSINKFNDQSLIKNFDLKLTYQDKYGVDIQCENLQFYLDFEWWKGERLLPYLWLDYEVSSDDFDVDLLWTNRDGETQWYTNVEEW